MHNFLEFIPPHLYRQFIPKTSVKFTSICALRTLYAVIAVRAPLFEKKAYVCIIALISNCPNPIWMHRTSSRPELATHYHPRNIREINFAYIFQQRFNGKKSNSSINRAQRVYAWDTVFLILD